MYEYEINIMSVLVDVHCSHSVDVYSVKQQHA